MDMTLRIELPDNQDDTDRVNYRRSYPAKMRRATRFSRNRGGSRFSGIHRRSNKRTTW